jgi:hypothetical protein
MAQALEEFEKQIEQPLTVLARSEPRAAAIVANVDGVKREFRRKLQTLASDCLDLMPSDVEINALELVSRR